MISSWEWCANIREVRQISKVNAGGETEIFSTFPWSEIFNPTLLSTHTIISIVNYIDICITLEIIPKLTEMQDLGIKKFHTDKSYSSLFLSTRQFGQLLKC